MRFNIRDMNILLLCHNNDCLSFIAEAIAKQLLPPKTQVFSAGLKGGKIDPKAVQVLREIGIKVSTQDEINNKTGGLFLDYWRNLWHGGMRPDPPGALGTDQICPKSSAWHGEKRSARPHPAPQA